jgi:hypothetical protein
VEKTLENPPYPNVIANLFRKKYPLESVDSINAMYQE